MKLLITLLSLALLGACNLAFAQWQWLDKDGRRVFSDRAPPPDVAEKNIVHRPSGLGRTPVAKEAVANDSANPPTDAPAVNSAPLSPGIDKDLEAKKKQTADAEVAKKKAEEERLTKARVENCARAKQAMVTFDAGLRIARTSATGEREVMDDASRATERARVQGIINSECR